MGAVGAHRNGHSDVPTGRRTRFRDQPCQLQLNELMTIAPAPPIEQRLLGMAAAILRLNPVAEVRLFGSRARGEAGADSDVDLLIKAPRSGGHPRGGSARCSPLKPSGS